MRDVWGNYVALRGVRAENAALSSGVAELEVQLQEQHALARRTEQLEPLLELQRVRLRRRSRRGDRRLPEPGHSDGDHRPGTRDGVRPHMAVISPVGVVGRVIDQPARMRRGCS